MKMSVVTKADIPPANRPIASESNRKVLVAIPNDGSVLKVECSSVKMARRILGGLTRKSNKGIKAVLRGAVVYAWKGNK